MLLLFFVLFLFYFRDGSLQDLQHNVKQVSYSEREMLSNFLKNTAN